MLLATSDDRDPLTAAIAAARRAGRAENAKWRDDLTAMTVELSSKFFGTRSVEMVRSGLALSIKLIGIGLLEQSKGAPDVELWQQSLDQLGIKGVTSSAIERIKTVATLPESPMLNGLEETEPRSLLLLCATCSDARAAWLWLEAQAQRRRDNLGSIRLARWLLAQTPSGRVKERNLRESDYGDAMLLADEVIDEVMANICGLPRHLDDIGAIEPCKLAPAKYREAREAYDELVAKLDAGLQKALLFDGRSWFDRFVLERKAPRRPRESPGLAK